MKRFYFIVSVIGMVVSLYLFCSSFFCMENRNDAIYCMLKGIAVAISVLGISLTVSCVYKSSRKYLASKKR